MWIFDKRAWTFRLRTLLLSLYMMTGLYDRLRVGERMYILHVGFSGHVSVMDTAYAEDKGLKPLSGLTLWMMEPAIASLIDQRRNAWREAVREVTGEWI